MKRALEGHFLIGGHAAMYIRAESLGKEYTTRTASYDFTLGMPQLDRVQHPGRVLPPAWTFEGSPEEASYERSAEVWGMAVGYGAKVVYPESSRGSAIVSRCRFYTALEVSNDDQLEAAGDNFLQELDDWVGRFTSWVGILTAQDFVALGGFGGPNSQPKAWIGNQDGSRSGIARDLLTFSNRPRSPMRHLEPQELEACVAATTRQDLPPDEWLFIRDARSLLSAGDYRRAVMDAGTAAELALTALVNQFFEETNTDHTLRKVILGNNAHLGRKKEVLNALRPGLLPATFETGLVQVRNNATHRGQNFSFEEAKEAIDLAAQVVETAYPLSALLPVQPTT